MNQTQKTSEIEIGVIGNKISHHTDGSMVFRDRFVSGVRLVDLLGGEVVIDPATTISVSSTDWGNVSYVENGNDVYEIDIFYGYSSGVPVATVDNIPSDPWLINDPLEIYVSCVDDNYEEITFHKTTLYNNKVNIQTTEKINAHIRLKRI